MIEGITKFFESFKMDSDVNEGHNYKLYIKCALLEFIKNNNKENAFDVYNTFFDCYRIKLQGNKSFIDLLDTLKCYEENASTLLDKQRDHYVHSVNVFLLGLYIYQNNSKFRNCFRNFYKKNKYNQMQSTDAEEFFFQWGIAALFHDIGYPVEISYGQIRKFISFVVEADNKEDAKPYIGYMNFDELNNIPINKLRSNKFMSMELEKFDSTKSIDLLSYSISRAFNIDYIKVKVELDSFLGKMQRHGFVDHGFYSAIIVLRWYAYLVEKSEIDADVLYIPILNAASAILLHNYYKNVLQKEPFLLNQMNAKDHPMAYLLILCDELQEWNREAYGILDKQRVLAADSEVSVDNNEIKVHFITYKGTLNENFAASKEEMFRKLLNLKEIFINEISITNTTKTELYIEEIRNKESQILPRPFIENIEQLAKQIHENYNSEQKNRNPNIPLEYPTWDSLTDSLKYSNIRQARGYFDKLKKLGYVALANDSGLEEVHGFSKEQIEILARDEHQSWCEERKQNGWTYGSIKDVAKKTSPYIVPYDKLSEEIKELDRDAVRNIFPLLCSIGLKIYKAK